jgi:very-short-patch-repair endonuclease
MPGLRRDISDRIAALAADHHGVLTTAQLRQIGVGEEAVTRRLAGGELLRVTRGVYVVAAASDGWTRVLARLRTDHRLVASGRLAAAIYRWDGFDRPSPEVRACPTLVTPWTWEPELKPYRRKDLGAPDITRHRGVSVTSPAWTLHHLEEEGVSRDELELAVECALFREDVSSGELADATGLLREVMTLRGADTPPTESALETKAVQAFRSHQLPVPLRQVKVFIGSRKVGRVDFLLPNWTVVETDGREHADPARKRADDIRDMEMAAVGLTVNRVGWPDVEYLSRELCDRLRLVIAQGRREPLPFRGRHLYF